MRDVLNNSTAVGATVGVNYHVHANDGAGGIAFRYVNTLGTSNVTPQVYDYAPTRGGQSGNVYNWTNHHRSNAAPYVSTAYNTK